MKQIPMAMFLLKAAKNRVQLNAKHPNVSALVFNTLSQKLP